MRSSRFSLPVLLLSLLLAVAVLWLLLEADRALDGGADPDPSERLGEAVVVTAAGDEGDPVSKLSRQHVEEIAIASDDGLSRLSGRFVDAVTGEPLEGATVRTLVGSPPEDWEDPTPAVSGADGRFELRFRQVPGLGVNFGFEKERYVSAWCWWVLKPAVDFDIGDLSLSPGVWRDLQVLDLEGVPIAGVQVRASSDGPRRHWERLRISSGSGLGGLTDDDGRVPGKWVRPGPWKSGSRQIPSLGPERFEVDGKEARGTIMLRADRNQIDRMITGIVVDTEGEPVSSLVLGFRSATADPESGGWEDIDATDGSGVFSASGLDPEVEQYEIGIAEDEEVREFDLVAGPKSIVARGATGVELVVARRPTASVEIAVIDSRSGQPVERYAYRLSRVQSDGANFVHSQTHSYSAGFANRLEGIARIDGVFPGSYVVSVCAEDPGLGVMISQPLRVDRLDEVRSEVAMPESRQWRVLVHDEGGAPVAGSRVRLGVDALPESRSVQREPDQWWEDVMWQQAKFVRRHWQALGGWRPIVSEAITDAEGLATLRSSVPLQHAHLEVAGALHRRCTLYDVAAPSNGGVLSVEVELCAVVEGTVKPLSLLAEFMVHESDAVLAAVSDNDAFDVLDDLPEVLLVDTSPDGDVVARDRLDGSGRFEIESVPPGDYDLRVDLRGFGGDSHNRHRVSAARVEQLRAGERRHVDLDLGQDLLIPCSGGVTIDGRTAATGLTLLFSNEERGTSVSAEVRNGRFAARIPAGSYWPRLTTSESRRVATSWFLDAPIHVETGQIGLDLHFQERVWELQLSDHRGEPLVERQLMLMLQRRPWFDRQSDFGYVGTDDAGRARISPAPTLAVELWMHAEPPIPGWAVVERFGRSFHVLETLQPNGAALQRFELVLPGGEQVPQAK